MGSFMWDQDYNGDMCYSQYYDSVPLSVALTEPYEYELRPFIDSDFTSNHHRSHSSGRRFKREYFTNIHYPQAYYNSCWCSSALPRRPINRCCSRDFLTEKFETVTIGQQLCRPHHYTVSYVRSPSPQIRQVKIRSRPSSCFNLHRTEITDNQQSKYIDQQQESYFQYEYNYSRPPERIIPTAREPSPPRKVVLHDVRTSTEDLYIPPPLPPPPPTKPVRVATRDTGTITVALPKRPLTRSETEINERYETEEKVETVTVTVTERVDQSSIAETNRSLQFSQDIGSVGGSSIATTNRSLHLAHDIGKFGQSSAATTNRSVQFSHDTGSVGESSIATTNRSLQLAHDIGRVGQSSTTTTNRHLQLSHDIGSVGEDSIATTNRSLHLAHDIGRFGQSSTATANRSLQLSRDIGRVGESSIATTNRSVKFSDDDDYDLSDQTHQQVTRRTQHQDFLQRTHALNDTGSTLYNSLNFYSDHGSNSAIVRPTLTLHDAFAETSGFTVSPEESSEHTSTTTRTTTTTQRASGLGIENILGSRIDILPSDEL